MVRCTFAVLAFVVTALHGAQTLPEKPRRFFNDHTGLVSRSTADRLNERLAQYERESSNQLIVAIYSRMLTNSSIEDYCTRAFQSWGVGREDRDNGAVLFVFTEDRKMRIQTGYGLEASLTDAECFHIIEGMKPFFRARDYTGGTSFAVIAMIEATKGEYKGTGKTLVESRRNSLNDLQAWLMLGLLLFMILIIVSVLQAKKRGYVYDSTRRYRLPEDRWWNTISWHSGSRSSGSTSSGWSGGGSSWSGGGGSTGGGGASGSW
ncbi:MAG TPA: hypothetical protein DDZ88_05340 [Verrucomicrobiales bacterium]|nr:hypothetical protein [Verrucomicrobiales bacterium]